MCCGVGEDEQLAALMESNVAAEGNLLAEARRIVLGNPETSRDAASSSTAGELVVVTCRAVFDREP